MATIIQPYNPWREQMAASILGPLIGGMIQRGQEANQNRKLNALRGELNARMTAPEEMAALTASNPADVMPEMPKLGDGLGAWQGTFNKIATPDVAQIGDVAGLTGQQAAWLNPQPKRAANPHEVLAELLSTPRFGMLNPQAAYEAMGPYLAEMEQQRRNAAAAELANSVMGAADDAERFNMGLGGVIRGEMKPEVLDRIAGMYQFNNPYLQPYEQDTGGAVKYGIFNPKTGQRTEQGSYDKTLSPDAAARNALLWAQYGLDRDKFYSDNEHWDRNFNASREDVLYDRENPKPYYATGPNGETVLVRGDRGTMVTVEPGPYVESMEEYDYAVSKFRREHPGWKIDEGYDKNSKYAYGFNPATNENVFIAEVGNGAPKKSRTPLVTQPKTSGGNGEVTERDRWKERTQTIRERLKAIASDKESIRGGVMLMDGETYPPDVQKQLDALSEEENRLAQELNALISGNGAQPAPQQPQTAESMVADVSNDPTDLMPEVPGMVTPDIAPQTPQNVSVDANTSAMDYRSPQGDVFSEERFQKVLKELDLYPELKEMGVKDAATLRAWLEAQGYTRTAR